VGPPGPEALGPYVIDRVATAMMPPVLDPSLFSEPAADVEAPAPVTP
jgi:hypothetical protein